MSKIIGDKSGLRLKAVLDILAEATLSGESFGAGAVLAEAQVRIPLDEREAELLSGGIPRGHKVLTTATAKLVKAGWLVKGRAGWTITEDGLRATVAFADPAAFAAALTDGSPVPADIEVPTAPAVAPAKAKAVRKPRPKAAVVVETVTETVVETVTETVVEVPAEAVELVPQPDAVAIAGDFGTRLGAPEDWAPQFDAVQMELDPAMQIWQLTAELPAGFYSFKTALNRSWEENYGAFGVFDGANHELHHGGGVITIRYDHSTKDISIA